MNRIKRWFKRTHKLVPIKQFNPTNHLSTVKKHREIIEGYNCPKCNNKNLRVDVLQEGNEGWQARVHCQRCNSNMVLNDKGFEINFIEAQQK